MEDIVAVVDGRPAIVDEVLAAPDDVRTYLRDRLGAWLGEDEFLVALIGHVGGEAERAAVVRERLQSIAGFEH